MEDGSLNDRKTPGIRSVAAHTCSRDLMSEICSRCGSKQLNFLVLHGPNGDGRALASDLQKVRSATVLALGEHLESYAVAIQCLSSMQRL